jgi:protein tyrosine/serine phosphatase
VIGAILQWSRSRSRRNPYGMPIANFGAVHRSRIYRGALPDLRGYAALADLLRVRTVVNLIDSDQRRERERAMGVGLNWYHVPMRDDEMPTLTSVETAVDLLSSPAHWPLYVHCKGGRHRTGGVVAAYRIEMQDWTNEDAYDEAKRFGFYSAFGHGAYKRLILGYRKEDLWP